MGEETNGGCNESLGRMGVAIASLPVTMLPLTQGCMTWPNRQVNMKVGSG